jgi:thiol-disulfide isomerase/thioredoxin
MRYALAALLVLALAPLPLLADDAPTTEAKLETPSVAWQAINAEARKQPYAKRSAHIKAAAEKYLEQFSAKGGMALGNEALSLGFMQRGAQQWELAAASFRGVWANPEVKETLRDQAAMHEAGLLGNSELRKLMGSKPCVAAIAVLTAYAAELKDDARLSMRSSIERNIASALQATERKQDAHDLRMAIVTRDPMMVGGLYRSLVGGLLGSTHAMDGYDGVRAKVRPLLDLLAAQQAKAIETLEAKETKAFASLKEKTPDTLNEAGKLKRTGRPNASWSMLERMAWSASRKVNGAKSLVARLEKAELPFTMLGKPAPEWTLEHGFGDLKTIADLKGKVVVLDFWATWCPWCIKSFPAIRDLLRDYEAKGLVVVGVTASSSRVYAARYDLDDDLKSKGEAGVRPKPAAQMARGSQKPDGKTIFSAQDFPAKEIEVIKTFIANHEMKWPVVMIDKTEPGPKYALGGWPHAVILDREGRIRYFKSGALLRDRVDAVKKFRAMLDDLLAEKAK